MKYLCYLPVLLSCFFLHAQKLQILTQGTPTSLRGLSCYNSERWVSGSTGTVGRSTDGGKNWQWITVPGYEKTEFRDVEALGNNTAVIMGISAPAYILKTIDGGNTWEKVYENRDTTMFLDAMAFSDDKHGLVIGDPVNGHFFVARTKDGGNSWQPTGQLSLPPAIKGEAFFAASGTNLTYSANGKTIYIVSGGMASRLFRAPGSIPQTLPLRQGHATTGANGIAVLNNKIMIAGGDFSHPGQSDSSFIYSNDKGRHWVQPLTPPQGYRSCVCPVTKDIWITCGITGVDITYDGGTHWKQVSPEGFNTCIYNKRDKEVILAGNNGKVGKIVF